MDATKQKTLPARARVVLSKLAFWCEKGRTCETTCTLIAGNTGLSKSQVTRGVADLKDAGFLIVHAKGQGKRSTYILTDEALEFFKQYRSELYGEDDTPEFAQVRNQEFAQVHILEFAHVQRLRSKANTKEIIISENEPPKLPVSPPQDQSQGSNQPTAQEAAMQILEGLGEAKNRNLSQEVKRNPEKALSILRWFLKYQENPYKPIADGRAYLKHVFSDPGDHGFRFEQGEWVPPPLPNDAKKSPGDAVTGSDAAAKSRAIDEAMAKGARDEALGEEDRRRAIAYDIDLAAWWNRLTSTHQALVAAEMGGELWERTASQKYKHFCAVRCFRKGLLPGATPPPEKPKKAGEP